MLAMIPRPVKAVLLLFPITAKNEKEKKEEDAVIEIGKVHAVDPTVIWIKQTASAPSNQRRIVYSRFMMPDI